MKKFGKFLIYLGSIIMIYGFIRFIYMFWVGHPVSVIVYYSGNPFIWGLILAAVGFVLSVRIFK